jgi:hypothetical protein
MNDYSLSAATPRAGRAETITTREGKAPPKKRFGMDDALMSDWIAISRSAPSILMLARATRQRETNDLPRNTLCESARRQRDSKRG